MGARSNISPSADQLREPPGSLPLNFVDFYEIVVGRWRLLLPALAFSLAIALVYVIVAPTRYAADMSILVDPRERVPVGIDAQAVPQNPDVALVESQMRLLTSMAVLRRVVESEHLVDDPDFKPGLVGRIIAALGAISHTSSPLAQNPIDSIAEALGKLIYLKRSERSYIVDVEVLASSPEKAVKLGNALVVAYFHAQTALSDEIVDKQTVWLDGRVKDLRTRVEEAERRVQDYRDTNEIALTEGHTSPERQLGDANAALVAARGKVAEVEARYNQLKIAMSRADAGQSTDDTIRSTVIEKLRQDYSALAKDEAYEVTVLGPRHPTYLTTLAQLNAVRAQIKSEIQRIFQATEREFKAAQATEKSAERLVSTTEASTNKVDDESLELKGLEREAATLRATFEKTLAQRENVRRDIIESPLGLVVDPPVARSSRTSPKVVPAFILALAAALNLWIVLALVADFRERRRETGPPPPPRTSEVDEAPSADVESGEAPATTGDAPPDSAPRRRHAAFGGFVLTSPRPANSLSASARGRPGSRGRTIANGVADAMSDERLFARSINALYDRVVDHFDEDPTTSRVALTSCTSDAGGSLIALALAHAAHEDGQRVLVVDCDGADSMLARCIAEQRNVLWPTRRRLHGRSSGDDRVAGEVVIVPLDRDGTLDAELDRLSHFDLVLFYCGSIDSTATIVNRWNATDVVVLVAKGPELDPGIVDELKVARIKNRCIGVVLTSDQERERKRA
jgi:uncharacterized protein involved in exopolysaccharide biosynthesis